MARVGRVKYTSKHILRASIKLFKTALKVSEIEVGSMLITEIGDVEVGYFHDYLTKTMKDDGRRLDVKIVKAVQLGE